MYVDFSAGMSVLLLAVIAVPAAVFGEQIAYRASSPRWQRVLIGYPLLCVGMLGLSLIALIILINILAPIAVAIWSLAH
jgi:cytochrome b561